MDVFEAEVAMAMIAKITAINAPMITIHSPGRDLFRRLFAAPATGPCSVIAFS